MGRYVDRIGVRPGFTLIELMVVVAVTIVLAGTSVAYVGSYVPRRQTEAVAVQLVQDLRQAQSDAVVTRSYVSVEFDVPSGMYTVGRAGGLSSIVRQFNSTIGYAGSILGAGFSGYSVYLTASVSSPAASPSIVTLYFSPFGTPLTAESSAASIEPQADGKGALIALAGRGGGRIDVRISPVVGQVSMEWK